MTITTHVLDTARGRPAAGVATVLEREAGDGWERVGNAATDADGRVPGFDAAGPGRFRLTFDTGGYLGAAAFYPRVTIEFMVEAGAEHYHVPLLLSPFGYSTYRGS